MEANIICSALESISYFATFPLSVNGLQELIRQARAGLRTDLLVPSPYRGRVGMTDRYLDKFTAAGGRFFQIDMQAEDWRRIKVLPRNLLLADERNAWRNDDGTWQQIAAGKEVNQVKEQLSALRSLGRITTGTQPKTIPELHFSADRFRVQPHENIHLFWSAPEADTVELQPGTGPLPKAGSRTVRVDETTEFILTARYGEAQTAKVIRIEVDLSLKLEYYLLATDPLGERSPARLPVRPDLPGFFGARQDQTISLVWKATNARQVWVENEPVAASGEQILVFGEQTSLLLRAEGVTGDKQEERIVLRLFTPPSVLPEVSLGTDFGNVDKLLIADVLPEAKSGTPSTSKRSQKNAWYSGLKNLFKSDRP